MYSIGRIILRTNTVIIRITEDSPCFENNLTAREGVNTIGAERLAYAANAVQNTLLQSSGGAVTADKTKVQRINNQNKGE